MLRSGIFTTESKHSLDKHQLGCRIRCENHAFSGRASCLSPNEQASHHNQTVGRGEQHAAHPSQDRRSWPGTTTSSTVLVPGAKAGSADNVEVVPNSNPYAVNGVDTSGAFARSNPEAVDHPLIRGLSAALVGRAPRRNSSAE